MTKSKKIVITTRSREIFVIHRSADDGIRDRGETYGVEMEVSPVSDTGGRSDDETVDLAGAADRGPLACAGPVTEGPATVGEERLCINPTTDGQEFDILTGEL